MDEQSLSVTRTFRKNKSPGGASFLSSETDTVILMIKDDGVGFDPASIDARQGHFGLLGMKERALKLDGEVTITSMQGAGTVITAALPRHPSHIEALQTSFSSQFS